MGGCGNTNPIQENNGGANTAPTDTTTKQITERKEKNEQKERITKLKDAYRAELKEKYKTEANKIITFYIRAQRLFYENEYKTALDVINNALEIRENADIYALKGSIYLGMGDTENFKKNWRKALEMDENVPLPQSEYIVDALKESGLINEDSEKISN